VLPSRGLSNRLKHQDSTVSHQPSSASSTTNQTNPPDKMRFTSLIATSMALCGAMVAAAPSGGKPCCCCDLTVNQTVCHLIPFNEGCFCVAVVCPDDAEADEPKKDAPKQQ
jgi:hypothetical protein